MSILGKYITEDKRMTKFGIYLAQNFTLKTLNIIYFSQNQFSINSSFCSNITELYYKRQFFVYSFFKCSTLLKFAILYQKSDIKNYRPYFCY